MKLLEVAARFDPELLDKRPACVPICVERLRLPSGAIQRKHHVRAKTLPHRMALDERLELPHELGVPAGLEIRIDPLLEHSKTLFFDPDDLRPCEGFELDVGQRRSAPQCECIAKLRGALCRIRGGASLCSQPAKPLEVELLGFDLERVTRRLRHQNVRPEGLAKLRDEVLE